MPPLLLSFYLSPSSSPLLPRSLAGHSGVVISGDWLVGGEQVT